MNDLIRGKSDIKPETIAKPLWRDIHNTKGGGAKEKHEGRRCEEGRISLVISAGERRERGTAAGVSREPRAAAGSGRGLRVTSGERPQTDGGAGRRRSIEPLMFSAHSGPAL